MVETENIVFLGFVLLITVGVLIAISAIFRYSFYDWFNTSLPPSNSTTNPCEYDVNAYDCTPELFNEYCAKVKSDGQPTNPPQPVIDTCTRYCRDTVPEISDLQRYCRYMKTCGLFGDERLQDCVRCDPNDLETCTESEVEILCNSGVASETNCKNYCYVSVPYSCSWLKWDDADQHTVNRICPRYHDCWREEESTEYSTGANINVL